MRLCTRIFVTLVFCFADAFFGFAFYFRWNRYDLFGKDLVHYSFARSMFELWLFSVLRVVTFAGAVVVLFDSEHGMGVIRTGRYGVGTANIFMVIFSLVKIMLYTEHLDGDHDDDAWFLSLGAWNMVASITMYAIWVKILQKEESTDPSGKRRKNKNMAKRKNAIADSESDDDILEKNIKPKEGDSPLFRVLSYTAPDWPLLLVGFASLIAATVGKVFIPKMIGQVLDGMLIKESKDRPDLRGLVITMVLMSVGIALTNGLRSGLFTLTSARLNRRITETLFNSIVTQELGFFDKNKTGAITSCLIADIATMSDMMGIKINLFLQSLFEFAGNLIFMIIISWRLTIVTAITFPILTMIADVFGSYYKSLCAAIQRSFAAANAVAAEAISSVQTVRSFANEEGELKRFGKKLDKNYQLQKKGAVARSAVRVLSAMFTLMMYVVTLFYGGHLVKRQLISGGMLVSYVLYNQAFSSCLQALSSLFADLMEAAGASRNVLRMIDRIPKISNEGKHAPSTFEGQVEFKNVSFAYPTMPSFPVLRDVSFRAQPGEVVALVGPSGGGKSSCISLIEHFYEPTSGEVLIDGRNVKDYDHAYLHEKIALVGQEPVLYARSILENISYSLKNCSTERIRKAAKQANAHKFIAKLKKGYKTEAGEKGLLLSGGQKQRVAIARALVRNPQILLLDEATSALDAQSEYVVQQALTKNFGNRTVIIVAHRLSTIENADRIVVIDHGMVVEQGRHQELIGSNGLYATLVRRQLRGHDEEGDVMKSEVEKKET